jgi:uncharacterized membrane protein
VERRASTQPPAPGAQTGSAVTATPLGTYLRGTFELMQGDRAVVTLDDGSVIDAETFDDEAPYRPGQRVVVWRTDEAYILDAPLRSSPLLLALGLFVGLAALVGRAKGLRAVAGTALTLGVLLYVVAPRLAAGRDVVTTMLLAVPGILLFTVYFVHGVNRKTTAALLGTLSRRAWASRSSRA